MSKSKTRFEQVPIAVVKQIAKIDPADAAKKRVARKQGTGKAVQYKVATDSAETAGRS